MPPAASVTWPQIVTAIVAGAAFVLSLVALVIQTATWRRSGFRPYLQTAWAVHTLPAGSMIPEVLIAVTVQNRGRSSGEFRALVFEPVLCLGRLSVRRPRNKQFVVLNFHLGEPPPTRVGGDSEHSYHVDARELAGAAKSVGVSHVRPAARLGNGRTVRGRPINLSGYQSES